MRATIELKYMMSQHQFLFVSSTDKLEQALVLIFAFKQYELSSTAILENK